MLSGGLRRSRRVILAVVMSAWAVLATAVLERAWLPEAVAGALAGQLGERMGLLEDIFGGVEPDPARLSKVARNLVESMADVVEGWGAAGVIKRAPDLRELGIGPHGNRHLDAMGRYQMCNAVLMLQLQNPAYQQDTNARVSAVFGLSAVTMAVLYLREPFMAGGGDPADIEAYLAGPTFEPLVQAMQSDDGTPERAEAACEPVVIELLREPISQLGPPPESP